MQLSGTDFDGHKLILRLILAFENYNYQKHSLFIMYSEL